MMGRKNSFGRYGSRWLLNLGIDGSADCAAAVQIAAGADPDASGYTLLAVERRARAPLRLNDVPSFGSEAHMGRVLQIIVAIAAVAFFIWLLLGSSRSPGPDAEIDPTDSRQIGELIGMTGGTVEDAAVAQFALRRFEQEHGRKPTVRDMGVVAGMMRSGR